MKRSELLGIIYAHLKASKSEPDQMDSNITRSISLLDAIEKAGIKPPEYTRLIGHATDHAIYTESITYEGAWEPEE